MPEHRIEHRTAPVVPQIDRGNSRLPPGTIRRFETSATRHEVLTIISSCACTLAASDNQSLESLCDAAENALSRLETETALRLSDPRLRKQEIAGTDPHHGLRDTLATVRSITRRTAETSRTVEEFAMHLDGRLDALSRSKSMVSRNPGAGVDLEYLVADELLAYATHERGQATISGPPIRLQPGAAEVIGLTIHELATNAVEHGGLSRPDSRLNVMWHVVQPGPELSAAPPQLRFEWIESGGPLTASKPRRRGFGTDFIERALRDQFGAMTTLEFQNRGLRCTIDLPLTHRVLQPA